MDGTPSQETQADPQAVAPGQANAPHEIELKLRASPEMIESVRQAPVIVQNARNRGVTRRLEAIYYDTPDRLLDRHAISLRVRRSGQHYVQTLKRAASGNPIARHEWETPAPLGKLDLAQLPIAEIGDPLGALREEMLQPVFSSKVRRRLLKLELDGALIEIAFDEGVLEAGSRSRALAEIELELKAGDAATLYELGLSLLEVAPLQIETASKAERGYRLAFEAAPAVTKAPPVPIVADDNVDAAIAKILGQGYAHLLANLSAVETGDDPDGVHQMRVALRRLRTAFSLFDRELAPPALAPLVSEARRLARLLGPARNWDVFLTQTLTGIGKTPVSDIDCSGLRELAEPLQTQSYAAIRERLASPEATRFFLSFGCLLERRGWRNGIASPAMTILAEPVSSLARRALARSHRKSLKRGRHFKQMGVEARHELRLSLKKLRYTTEFFLPLHADDSAAGKYLKRMARLQDALGAANDAVTTQPLLDEIRRCTDEPGLHYATGAIIGWQRREQVEAAKGLLRKWRKFEATKPFWE